MAPESNLKAAVLELKNVFARHLPAEDVPDVLRRAVEKALGEVLGDAPKRRGLAPKSATAAPTAAATGRGNRKPRGLAARRKQAERMRAYWKARKAAEASATAQRRERGRPARAAPETTDTPTGGA